MSRRLKVDIVAEIAGYIGIEVPHMSTGSTEPRALFDAVNVELGLGISDDLTKPQMAQAVVEAAGFVWKGTHESNGGTVTTAGLIAVEEAVALLTGN
jgi:hypothetical protein